MCFRANNCPMLVAETAKPSLVEGAMRMGLPFLRCAFAPRVMGVSAMPLANLPKVFPVHGAMTSRSRIFLGPMGSAAAMVLMTA